MNEFLSMDTKHVEQRRRSSRISALQEQKSNELQNQQKVDANLEEWICIIEIDSDEPDDERDDELYSPTKKKKTKVKTSRRRRPSTHQRRRARGSGTTSRTNGSSSNVVPASNDHQNVFDLPQRVDPNEQDAEPENNPNIEPSSDDEMSEGAPIGEVGQQTTTAEHAIFSSIVTGENIGSHSATLGEGTNAPQRHTTQEPGAAENTTIRETFNGQTSMPWLIQSTEKEKEKTTEHGCANALAADTSFHHKNGETDKGKGKMLARPSKLLTDAMRSLNPITPSNSWPSFSHSEHSSLSTIRSNPNNSLHDIFDLNQVPDHDEDLQALISPNMSQQTRTFNNGQMLNQQPQRTNNAFPLSYENLQRGIGILNPMGPFPVQLPQSPSAEPLPPSNRFMEQMWMRNHDHNQPQGGVVPQGGGVIHEQDEQAQPLNNEANDDNELDLELRL
ncbi:hypothetical protein VNO78_31388 [Psophocarpus tetragonolobus]|uniref:Uncharacterized protein n=1 Tax=Psophocarpus tetragonolobus TaxID=3891 RepID=A0AAN9RYF8_PSOTE